VTGRFASRIGHGTSSKHCRNPCGMPPTGLSFICSKSKSRSSPSHFPTQTRCQARTASIFYLPSDGLTIWYTVTESPGIGSRAVNANGCAIGSNPASDTLIGSAANFVIPVTQGAR
jgi:hypothetical protein